MAILTIYKQRNEVMKNRILIFLSLILINGCSSNKNVENKDELEDKHSGATCIANYRKPHSWKAEYVGGRCALAGSVVNGLTGSMEVLVNNREKHTLTIQFKRPDAAGNYDVVVVSSRGGTQRLTNANKDNRLSVVSSENFIQLNVEKNANGIGYGSNTTISK